MKNLWKGIAIAGIWIGLGVFAWACAFAIVYADSDKLYVDTGVLAIFGFAATWLIKSQD
jgi:hypothetical protein